MDTSTPEKLRPVMAPGLILTEQQRPPRLSKPCAVASMPAKAPSGRPVLVGGRIE